MDRRPKSPGSEDPSAPAPDAATEALSREEVRRRLAEQQDATITDSALSPTDPTPIDATEAGSVGPDPTHVERPVIDATITSGPPIDESLRDELTSSAALKADSQETPNVGARVPKMRIPRATMEEAVYTPSGTPIVPEVATQGREALDARTAASAARSGAPARPGDAPARPGDAPARPDAAARARSAVDPAVPAARPGAADPTARARASATPAAQDARARSAVDPARSNAPQDPAARARSAVDPARSNAPQAPAARARSAVDPARSNAPQDPAARARSAVDPARSNAPQDPAARARSAVDPSSAAGRSGAPPPSDPAIRAASARAGAPAGDPAMRAARASDPAMRAARASDPAIRAPSAHPDSPAGDPAIRAARSSPPPAGRDPAALDAARARSSVESPRAGTTFDPAAERPRFAAGSGTPTIDPAADRSHTPIDGHPPDALDTDPRARSAIEAAHAHAHPRSGAVPPTAAEPAVPAPRAIVSASTAPNDQLRSPAARPKPSSAEFSAPRPAAPATASATAPAPAPASSPATAPASSPATGHDGSSGPISGSAHEPDTSESATAAGSALPARAASAQRAGRPNIPSGATEYGSLATPNRVDLGLFDRLSDSDRQLIRDYSTEAHFDAGHTILSEGDPSDGAYFILQGQVRVDRGARTDGAPLAILDPGDVFGEGAADHHPRNATIRAITAVTTLRLAMPELQKLLQAQPHLKTWLNTHYDHRRWATLLKERSPFSELSQKTLYALIDRLSTVNFTRGHHVFREGDAPGPVYIVREGFLRVVKYSSRGEKTIAYLRPGSVLGMSSCFQHSPRKATATALTDISLLELPAKHFQAMHTASPTFLKIVHAHMAGIDFEREAPVPLDVAELFRSQGGGVVTDLEPPSESRTEKHTPRRKKLIALAAVAGALVLALGIAQLSLRFPEEVEAPFSLNLEGSGEPVKAPLGGTLEIVEAAEGREVKAGQLLFVINSADLVELDTKVKSLKRELEQPAPGGDGGQSLRAAENRVNSLSAELQYATAQKAKTERLRKIAESSFSQKLIAEDALKREQAADDEAGRALENIRRAIADAREKVAELKAQPERSPQEIAAHRAKLEQQLQEAEASLAAASQAAAAGGSRLFRVLAPRDGTITSVAALKPGTVIDREAVLCTVTPVGAQLRAELLIPELEAGRVRPAQPARLMLDEFPQPGAGRNGVISWVSPAPEHGVVRANAALEESTIVVDGVSKPLRAGMHGRARVRVRDRSLFDYLFE